MRARSGTMFSSSSSRIVRRVHLCRVDQVGHCASQTRFQCKASLSNPADPAPRLATLANAARQHPSTVPFRAPRSPLGDTRERAGATTDDGYLRCVTSLTSLPARCSTFAFLSARFSLRVRDAAVLLDDFFGDLSDTMTPSVREPDRAPCGNPSPGSRERGRSSRCARSGPVAGSCRRCRRSDRWRTEGHTDRAGRAPDRRIEECPTS